MQQPLFKTQQPIWSVRPKKFDIEEYLENFFYTRQTKIENFEIQGKQYKKFINEFWTPKQRQSNSLHGIAYRACFKAELPNFFIQILSWI